MKHLISLTIVLLIAFAVCVQPAQAQITPNFAKVKVAATYANSQNDTSVVVRLAAASLISATLFTNDTVAVDVYIQYSANYYSGATATWSTIVTDSLVYANTAKGFAQYSIKDTDSDLLDGVSGALRTVLVFRAAANGVTTPTYTYQYEYVR